MESFKKQVELSSEKAYADMKQQVSSHINNHYGFVFTVFSQTEAYRVVNVLVV